MFKNLFTKHEMLHFSAFQFEIEFLEKVDIQTFWNCSHSIGLGYTTIKIGKHRRKKKKKKKIKFRQIGWEIMFEWFGNTFHWKQCKKLLQLKKKIIQNLIGSTKLWSLQALKIISVTFSELRIFVSSYYKGGRLIEKRCCPAMDFYPPLP